MATTAPADQSLLTVTVLSLLDFVSGDSLEVIPATDPSALLSLVIQVVEPANDIVYLDENYLPASGQHLITMMEGT